MSSVTTHTGVEVEADAPSRTVEIPPLVRPLAEPTPLPIRRGGFEDRWPFIAMILSLCLFAAVFAKTVIQPAAETVSAMSSDHWTDGP